MAQPLVSDVGGFRSSRRSRANLAMPPPVPIITPSLRDDDVDAAVMKAELARLLTDRDVLLHSLNHLRHTFSEQV